MLSQNQTAAKRPDTPKSTPALGRLSWNGHAGLTPTYARHVGWMDDETTKVLRRLLRDREAGALAIFDVVGPRGARAVANELLALAAEVI